MTRRLARLPILFAAGAAALCAVETVPAANAQNRPPPAVVVAPAQVSDIRPRASFTGRLRAVQKIDLRARVSGFVEEVSFEEGGTVEKGDVLYRIEDDAYRAAVSEIEGNISAAEADMRLAELDVERKRQLVDRNVTSEAELDVSVANVGKAEGALARLKAQLERAQLELSYTEIVAPFDGITGLSNVDAGAFVEPSTGALTTLTRLDPMMVEFPVTTAQYLRYRLTNGGGNGADTPASVALLLPDDTRYDGTGEVNFVDAQVSESTDTVTVRAEFDNPDGLLLDGALVGVELTDEREQLVINVPQEAVQRDQAGAFVMVVGDDDTAELRRVEIARIAQGRAVIGEGLEEGELVITEGINKVRPGIAVDAAIASES